MLAVSHTIIGASLAKLIPNPFLGLPLSLASHFLADLIPHWDFRTRHTKRTVTQTIFLSGSDALIGFLIGFFLFSSQVPLTYLTLMMFTAQLPDWLEAPWHIFNWKFPPFSNIKKLQSKLHRKLDFPMGLIIQLVVVILFALIAFFF